MNPCLGPLIDPPGPSSDPPGPSTGPPGGRTGGSARAHRPVHSSGARPEKPVATRMRACRVLPLPGYRKT
ncbi:hypothetical protein KRMM14A1004_27430 [Krasilnikovia sp. MM14-A1004]